MRRLLLAACLLTACAPGTTGPADDDDDATNDPADAGWFCATAPAAEDLGGAWGVESDRYSLYVEGTAAQAEDFASILEAGYDAYAAWWGHEGDPTAPLRVEFYASEAAMLAAIAADGVIKPTHAGGYYHPDSGTAYLYDQPTRYYDQVLLLHEAGHQLHDQFRGLGGQPGWYVEGSVEYLSRHDWDGECLRLGRLPQLSQEDMADDARGAWAGQSLQAVADGGGRPGWYGLLRFLDREHPDALHAALSRIDAGEGTEALWSELGDTAGLDDDLRAFLDGDQEPLTPTYLEWLHRRPGEVLGWADGVVSIARVKEAGAELSAWFGEPDDDGWAGGVLVGWDSGDDWLAVLLDGDGTIYTFDVVAGAATWWSQGAAPPAADGGWRVDVSHAAGGTEVTFGDSTALYEHGLTPAAGLALNDTELLFTDLAIR